MSEKPKMIAVTDPELIEALTKDPADLSHPVTYKPNGHLWVLADQFEAWRAQRDSGIV